MLALLVPLKAYQSLQTTSRKGSQVHTCKPLLNCYARWPRWCRKKCDNAMFWLKWYICKFFRRLVLYSLQSIKTWHDNAQWKEWKLESRLEVHYRWNTSSPSVLYYHTSGILLPKRTCSSHSIRKLSYHSKLFLLKPQISKGHPSHYIHCPSKHSYSKNAQMHALNNDCISDILNSC